MTNVMHTFTNVTRSLQPIGRLCSICVNNDFHFLEVHCGMNCSGPRAKGTLPYIGICWHTLSYIELVRKFCARLTLHVHYSPLEGCVAFVLIMNFIILEVHGGTNCSRLRAKKMGPKVARKLC